MKEVLCSDLRTMNIYRTIAVCQALGEKSFAWVIWNHSQLQKRKLRHRELGPASCSLLHVKSDSEPSQVWPQFSSVQFSHSVVSDSLQPHESQLARPPCPSPTPGVHPNPCPLSQWCHPTISSSVVPFSSHLQSFPVSGSFQMSQFFSPGGQSIGVSASTSVLPMNTQVWSPLGWTDWISLKSKGLSRVFSNTTVQKHQFFTPEAELFTDITLSLKPPRTSWAFPSSHPIPDLQSSAKTLLFQDIFFDHYKVMANSLFGSPQPFTVSTLILAVTLCCLLFCDSGGQWKELLLNHTDLDWNPPWVLSGCMTVHSFTTKYSFST